MPHPREAIYDVMKAQQEREQEERRIQREGLTQAEALEAWSADNKRARSAARQ
jgi:hypothetical protein